MYIFHFSGNPEEEQRVVHTSIILMLFSVPF
jgi:hypothetical protein